MTKKLTLLAAAAIAALAFAALPAIASAAPEVTLTGSTKFSNNAVGEAKLVKKSGTEVACPGANNVEGEFAADKTSTGKISITFKGCHDGLVKCSSAGAATGEIVTGPYEFHLVYLEKDVHGNTYTAKTTVGILVTPNGANNKFANFSCLGVPIEVRGTGVLGHVENKCNETPNAVLKTNFAQAAAGQQTYQLVGTTNTHLESNQNGGAFEESSEIVKSTATLLSGTGTIDCN